MKLYELLYGLEYTLTGADENTEISAPVSDSRLAKRDSMFLCISGTKRDGADYAVEARLQGAAACVAERPVRGVPCVTVDNVRHAAAIIWNNFYKDPARRMRLFGVTGTNGKTSTAVYLKSILEACGRKVGLIGTLGCYAGERKLTVPGSELSDVPAAMTTPDPQYLYGALSKMRDEGIEDAVIEVSSHAVYQRKTDALSFFCGIFTNLSPEHLDLHGDMESYFAVKKSFLDKCKIIVYNRDDKYGRRFYPLSYNFGISDAGNIRLSAEKTRYLLNCGGEKINIEALVPGGFTVYNTMAAACCAAAVGVSPGCISQGIFRVKGIPGRMERVLSREKYGFTVYIDFAHTPAALEAVLRDLKKTNAEKLTVLFGCGGDRDRGKRSIMGEIAAKYSDRVIVTSDNPRTEDRLKIIDDILEGIPKDFHPCVIPSRKDAICYALESAVEGEIILLAGKGQEEYEIVNGKKLPFSEKEIIAEVMKRKFGK
ncbi:MAG: UDP-N-acetylmuramoyl-L-alanyl-D-glutamate--2,6-diaminopimelate ligase [Clostridia bacterium]|nr:UDP-N-acetylmuramoyl-L-alanyl-D-glutamate--2,6-diaminopimelate ligase [Clostridia bacterium]